MLIDLRPKVATVDDFTNTPPKVVPFVRDGSVHKNNVRKLRTTITNFVPQIVNWSVFTIVRIYIYLTDMTAAM